MFKFYLARITIIAIYICTWLYSVWFFLSPVIATHGGWTTLWTFLVLFLIGFVCGFLLVAIRKPMATRKPLDNYWRFTQ